MKHLFIINPPPGSATVPARSRRRSARPASGAVSTMRFSSPAHPATAHSAHAAAASGAPVRVYACGGDGTLNEVVNGVQGLSQRDRDALPPAARATTSSSCSPTPARSTISTG